MGVRGGHFLKMAYPILSKGDGADLDFIFVMILIISLAVNGLQSISTSGAKGVASMMAGRSCEGQSCTPQKSNCGRSPHQKLV